MKLRKKNSVNKYNNYAIIAVGLICVLLLGGVLKSRQSKKAELIAFRSDVQLVEDPRLSGVVGVKVEHPCEEGKTAFDSLIAYADTVQFKDFSFGKQVTSINGVANTESTFWLFSIDEIEASVSADSYVCRGNETITWELK